MFSSNGVGVDTLLKSLLFGDILYSSVTVYKEGRFTHKKITEELQASFQRYGKSSKEKNYLLIVTVKTHLSGNRNQDNH